MAVKPGELSRKRLVEHATYLFHREGFNAVGVNRLAAEVGMSKKTIYQHFRSKNELLEEVLNQYGEKTVHDYSDESDDSSPRQRLLNVFDTQHTLCSTPSFYGCFLLNIATEFRNPAHPAVRLALLHKGNLTRYVQRQAELAGAADPAALAEQLTALHIGAAEYTLLTGRYPETTHRAVEALLHAQGIN